MGSYQDDLDCAAGCDGEKTKRPRRPFNRFTEKSYTENCYHCYSSKCNGAKTCPWCKNSLDRKS